MNDFEYLIKARQEVEDTLSKAKKELTNINELSPKKKKQIDEKFQVYQTARRKNPDAAEKFFREWEKEKIAFERSQIDKLALEGDISELEKSVVETNNLIKKKETEIGIEEGKKISKEFKNFMSGLILLEKRAAVVIDLLERSQISSLKKHYMGMVTVKVKKGSRLEGIYAYNPPVEVRTRADEPVNVHLETRREDKPIFVSMGVEGALELQATGEIQIMDDLEKVPFEMEPRYSSLPSIYDILSSIKLHLIPGNGLSPELQEYAEKQIPLTVFDAGRLMSESEKTALLKKILNEG